MSFRNVSGKCQYIYYMEVSLPGKDIRPLPR